KEKKVKTEAPVEQIAAAAPAKKRRGRRSKAEIEAAAAAAAQNASGEGVPTASKSEIEQVFSTLQILADEKGYLTFKDVNKAFPNKLASPENIDMVLAKLKTSKIK